MSDHSSSPSRAGTPVATLPEVQTARPYRFTWDHVSRRPGPESVSGTTEGQGDYIIARPRLDLLNTSAVSLALGALPAEWSSSKHGFHAISTVLNNPHKRQAPPKAHSALPAVPPADLPRVRRKDFDLYLRAISPEWERFLRSSQLGREGIAQLDGPSTPRPSMVSEADSIPHPSSLHSLSSRNIPPLETVPPIFFQSHFNLGDPRTFRAVTEQDDAFEGSDTSDPLSLSYTLPLLEKFSHYADTVEQHLVREISVRSTSFFAALTNLNELQTESEECLDRIGRLRGLLQDVDENNSKRGLKIVRKELKLQNFGKLKESVKFIGGIVEMTGVARGLVSAGQWGEALNIIEDLETIWDSNNSIIRNATPADTSIPQTKLSRLSHFRAAESTITEEEPPSNKHPQDVRLSSLSAFSALPEHLRTLTLEIASSLSIEVVGVLRADFLERTKPQPPGHDTVDQLLKDRLRPLLHGLVRTKGMKEAILSWRDIALVEIKNVMNHHLPRFDIDEEPDLGVKSEQRPGLGNHLRSMSHAEFLTLIQAIYKSLLNGVEGLQAQGRIMVEVLESIQSVDSLDIPALQEELSDILSSAAELANTRAARVINPRSEQHASLELFEFVMLFNESWGFVVKCEVICRRMIVGLRGVVVSQAKGFLQAFHQIRLSRSAKLVEDEQWNPAEILPALQHIADILVNSAVQDAKELILSDSEIAISQASLSINGTALASPSATQASVQTNGVTAPAPGSKHLRIEDRSYYAVSATTEVLALLLDYLRVVVNLSMLTTDTMSRVIEFLKAFNSRTCQVVLGAGAMRSAGLKNITAKHLALASQSLSIMIALIPYVRETFRRHLSSKQAVMLVEFDKLKRDFQEHQNEIHAKLVAIMGDRLSTHIKTLQAIDWNGPKPATGVNEYMEILVKETVTLHKVLSRYLPIPIVEYVMTQVFAAINHRLSEEYGKIELPHEEAKARLLADARFLHQKLSALKNVGPPSNMLETVVEEKSLPRKNPTTPVSANTVPSTGLTANQRLKGLLSGKSMSAAVDKALPTPNPTSPPTASTPSPVVLPASPPVPPPRTSSLNGRLEQLMGSISGGHDTSPLPPIPRDEHSSSTGFKRVESPKPGGSESEPPDPGSETSKVLRTTSATVSADARQREETEEVLSPPVKSGSPSVQATDSDGHVDAGEPASNVPSSPLPSASAENSLASTD